jgi:hypothetical protein
MLDERKLAVAVEMKDQLGQGDVVILKKQAVGRAGKLMTYCTICGQPFPTLLRRMKRGEAVYRNVPQCKDCRHAGPSRGIESLLDLFWRKAARS